MRNVFRVLTARPLMGHWKSKLAVAATLLTAISIGFLSLRHGAEQAAFGLEDLPKRLLEIKSIYLTGWLFEPINMSSMANSKAIERIGIGGPGDALHSDDANRPKYPIKYFAERPDCYWHTGYGFSGPDSTHKDVRVSSGFSAARGTKLLQVSHDNKTAIESTVSSTMQNELLTEMFFQSQLPQEWLNGQLSDFVKTGVETINNIACDVYEQGSDDRKQRLWLDPKTGLPVQIASYQLDKDGKEHLAQIIDHVEVNIPADATDLSFEPPEGYQVTKVPQSKTGTGLNSLGCCEQVKDGVSFSLGAWFWFNLDDKAVLCCWYCDKKSESEADKTELMPEFLLGKEPCVHREIASTKVDDIQWNWSLVFPKQAGDRLGNNVLKIIYRIPSGGVMFQENRPLRLREDRLKAVLAEVQQTTQTTLTGSSEPLSLESLRKQFDQRP